MNSKLHSKLAFKHHPQLERPWVERRGAQRWEGSIIFSLAVRDNFPGEEHVVTPRCVWQSTDQVNLPDPLSCWESWQFLLSLDDEILLSCRQWKVWLPTFRVVDEVASPPFTWSLCAMVIPEIWELCAMKEHLFPFPSSSLRLFGNWRTEGVKCYGLQFQFSRRQNYPSCIFLPAVLGCLPLFHKVHFPSAPVSSRGSGALQIPLLCWFSECTFSSRYLRLRQSGLFSLVSHIWCWNNKTSAASLQFWDPRFQFSSLCSKSMSASHRLLRQQHKVTYLLPFVLISELCCKELPDFANSEGKEGEKRTKL